MLLRRVLIVLVLSCASVAPGVAQRAVPSLDFAAVRPLALPAVTTSFAAELSNTELTLVALAASGAGFFIGAYGGYQIERAFFPCTCDDPGLMGMIIGMVAGPAIVTPIVTHLANDRRGSLGQAYSAAALIAALGLAGTIVTASSEAGLIFVIATPIAQGISAAHFERKTQRH